MAPALLHNTPNSCALSVQDDDIVYTHRNMGQYASHPGGEEAPKGSAVRR